MAQQKKHVIQDATNSKILLEFEGQVPRVGEYVTIVEKDEHGVPSERGNWRITAVIWHRWWPAVRDDNWDGTMFALLYARRDEQVFC